MGPINGPLVRLMRPRKAEKAKQKSICLIALCSQMTPTLSFSERITRQTVMLSIVVGCWNAEKILNEFLMIQSNC